MVFVLVGAKSAGKSTLAEKLQAQSAVRFIDVENHFLNLLESQRSMVCLLCRAVGLC